MRTSSKFKGVAKSSTPFKPNNTMASRPNAFHRLGRKPASVDGQELVIDPKESDIIIPIIGPTGFGKSRIINDIVGRVVMPEGHGLQPCTLSIQHVVVPHCPHTGDRRIILVDTPGIAEDPMVDEAQILGRIDGWMKRSYPEGMRIAGIIYLYDITQQRALSTYGQPSDNTGMFKKLCGDNWFERIILGTTKWDDIKTTPQTESQSEERLRNTYWNGMGPTMIKVHSGSSSARELVKRILDISAKVPRATPVLPQAMEHTSHRKILRGFAVRAARERPDSFKVLDPDEHDIVIAIIGPMGVGKSTIINSIAGRTVMTVRHGLQQLLPSSIQYVAIPHPNDSRRRIILVDTPGFDRTYEDAEILRRISDWLANSYGKEMKLSGIICLHDISQKCLSQPSHKNLTVFRQLCGDGALANVILGTTKWGQVKPEVGQDRERQLADGHWREMVLRGSTIMQVQSDESSVWKIIDRILGNVDLNLVQDELIEVQKLIPDTLRYRLKELLEQRKEIDLQLVTERKALGRVEGHHQELGDIWKRIGETIAQIAKLKVPLGPRIKTVFGAELTKQAAGESEVEIAPRDTQGECQTPDCSTLLWPTEPREDMSNSPYRESGADRDDETSNKRPSDDQESTHSACSGIKYSKASSESLGGSTLSVSSKVSIPRVRQRLTGNMAKASRDIMNVLSPKESDIVVPIMGPTGAGKSSMINRLAKREAMTVGHELQSCTSSIQHVIVHHPAVPDRRIILVDTPGFDDTYVDDAEILRRIALWLACSYGDGMNLAGIVYLHDICQSRMTGTSSKNLEMFTKLCGNDALANVVLGTTKWSDVSQKAGERREKQLGDIFWQEMIAHGSIMLRVLDDEPSAWAILGRILQNRGVEGFVRIQKELVEERKFIEETEAGKTLCYTQKQYEALQQQRELAHQMEEDSDQVRTLAALPAPGLHSMQCSLSV